MTGVAVSGEPETVSARASIASSCVDALLGARPPPLAALVHICQTKKDEAVGLHARQRLAKVKACAFAHSPVWHRCPVQPRGQAHWSGLKQVPPFTQGCPHTAARHN